MISIGVIIYFVFCALVGVCGIHRRLGFVGTFLVTFIITPPLMLVVLMLTSPSTRYMQRYR